MRPEVLDLALDALESLEIRSLTWGFVDHTLGQAEAEAAIGVALHSKSLADPAAEVLEALCNAALVRSLEVAGELRYRTRIAELTRLLSRLRQWFTGQPWQAAPTLVSDFRINTRARRYPRRNITPQEAWGRLNAGRNPSALQTRVWKDLTGNDPSFALSEFQVEAARRLLNSDPGTGTIVTAGTGSGKTLAFYLPALIAIAPEVRSGEWWTKVICIYPRQELLKDQLSEAYRLTLRAAASLRQERRRPFVLGSLFGPTPFSASEDAVIDAKWISRGNGYVCPFLRCPKCAGDMVWSKELIHLKREVLVCVKDGCKTDTDGTTLRLTRQSVAAQPPDLLFTTTEMMNQRLSDTWSRGVFGVGRDNAHRPLFVLLDEVHTYGGVSGAQVALLLRRWSALLGSRVRWGGLSATLPQPDKFFSDLTGVRADRVACIAPKTEDLILEGAEYNIILRSDPSSQAATLSTSIQAIMLLARMLDPRDRGKSGRRFGSRTFVFTDDLDVTHRLFDNLLDAEAYTRRRQPDNARQPLAALRGSTQPDTIERELQGQCWEMAEELRSSLATRLRIGRTTSRDPGVDAAADVIVATSSLEVGFNDPDVGAVVQHKAPRSAASFLQRRGRAGRPRGMRPLTLIVLSDYGRDRVAFQSYEHLFDPTVEIQALPVRNLYVLRMQAVYATLEWITAQAPRDVTGWAWRAMAEPGAEGDNQSTLRAHFRDTLQSILRFDAATLGKLRTHLTQALCVDSETLDMVLWQPPRALLLDALPTLGRRLFRQWQLASGQGLDLHQANPPHPLPDFIPANLFSDLNLPEVQIEVPAPGTVQLEPMPIVQALQQFVPGRVRRRFADHQGKVSHWFPLDLSVTHQRLKISDYARRHEYVGNRGDLTIFRPWQVAVVTVPYNVSETSNAQWTWQSDFEALGDPTIVQLPTVAGLNLVADRLEFRLHRFGSGFSVRRFAHEGEATARVNRQERRFTFELVDERDKPAAIGFAFEADALLVPFRLPPQAALANLVLPPGLVRWLRYEAFARHVECDPSLSVTHNYFRLEWLHQATLLTAIVLAEGAELPLRKALQALRDDGDPGAFTPAIDALVNATFTAWGDDDEAEADGEDGVAVGNHGLQRPQRLRDALTQAIAEPGVMNTLIDVALRWTAPSTDDWGRWLAEVACTTFGEAVHQACVTAVPQNTSAEGLTVDVEVTTDGHRAIIAETTLGGGGTVEALAEVFAADPRAFVRSLESACAPSDQEMAADELRRVLSYLAKDQHLAAVLARLRAASDTETRDQTRREFFTLLAGHGIPVSRTLSVGIATRLIRPGMSPDGDALCADLLQAWQALEEKHGISFPLRLATAAVAQIPKLKRRLAIFGGAGKEILTAGMLLWPIGGELRRRALQSYNPFRRASIVDAALVRQLLFEARLPSVSIDAPDWLSQLKEYLAAQGIVRLTTGRGDQTWRGVIARLLSEPIISGYLQFYPTIEATRVLEDGQLAVDLVLRDRV